MKVTFETVPNPSTDPAGFVSALNANFALVDTSLELVVDRTVLSTMLADIIFTTPQSDNETYAQVGNGNVISIVPEVELVAPVLSAERTFGPDTVSASWTEAGPLEVTEYRLYRSLEDEDDWTLIYSGLDLEFEDTDLDPIDYDYKVEADMLDTTVTSNEVNLHADEFHDDTFMLLQVEDGVLVERTGFPNVSVVGGGVVSSAQAKFGTQSFSNPGTTTSSSNYISVIGSPTDFTFPGEFTFECWLYYRGSHDTFNNIFANNINYPGAGFLQLAILSTGNLFWNCSPGNFYTSVNSVTANTWQHIAITRDSSNILRFFINGVTAGVTSGTGESSGTVGGASGGVSTFDFGRGHASDNSDLDTYFEEVRVTKRCRYIANFTPPTAPFPY